MKARSASRPEKQRKKPPRKEKLTRRAARAGWEKANSLQSRTLDSDGWPGSGPERDVCDEKGAVGGKNKEGWRGGAL